MDPTSPPTVRTVAKDDEGPPPGVVQSGVFPPVVTVLVVPDELVETVLADVGVRELPRRDGKPFQTGRYAEFDGSDDLATGEVLVVWYSGQSGTCPSYLQGLRVTARGDIDVVQASEESDVGLGACSADYRAYRQLAVVSEDDVPALSELPLTGEGEDGTGADDFAVDVYPPSSAP